VPCPIVRPYDRPVSRGCRHRHRFVSPVSIIAGQSLPSTLIWSTVTLEFPYSRSIHTPPFSDIVTISRHAALIRGDCRRCAVRALGDRRGGVRNAVRLSGTQRRLPRQELRRADSDGLEQGDLV